MNPPKIKLIALSNVYCRMMMFVNAGDVEQGHKHTYDHATLVSSGSVMVEMLNDDNTVTSSKKFFAPNMIFIHKDHQHRITSLEDNTVCTCIHAIRDIKDNILDPDFLIEPLFSTGKGELIDLVAEKHKVPMKTFAI